LGIIAASNLEMVRNAGDHVNVLDKRLNDHLCGHVVREVFVRQASGNAVVAGHVFE
jgi:hypothetical protein